MRNLLFGRGMVMLAATAALYLVPVSMMAQEAARLSSGAQPGANAADKTAKATPRLPDGHPDLNGVWRANGFQFTVEKNNGSINVSGGPVVLLGTPTALKSGVQHRPTTGNVPPYKPELEAKVNELDDKENKVDKVFYCGRPGVPRLGPPQQIVQTPGQVVFLYEDIAGEFFRVIPTDGRPHRADMTSTYNGDSVGHWEGDTLVVDARNFVDDTWMGEWGYFHSPQMRVMERLRREGDSMTYQVTVDDPGVLTKPWAMDPRTLRLTNELPEEEPPCVEKSGQYLDNSDHHRQRQ